MSREMYGKVHKNTLPHLIYGSKLRYARCLVSNATTANKLHEGTFTQAEMQQIQEISDNAIRRASKEREEEIRRLNTTVSLSEVSGRAETEFRTYNGK